MLHQKNRSEFATAAKIESIEHRDCAMTAAATAAETDPRIVQVVTEIKRLMARYRQLDQQYKQAMATLPAWAKEGPSRFDATTGKLFGDTVSWPEREGWREQYEQRKREGHYENINLRLNVRPSLDEVKRDCQFGSHSDRRKAVRAWIARLRHRRALEDQVGLTAIDAAIEETSEATFRAMDSLTLDAAPTAQTALDWFAARIISQALAYEHRDIEGLGYLPNVAPALTPFLRNEVAELMKPETSDTTTAHAA